MLELIGPGTGLALIVIFVLLPWIVYRRWKRQTRPRVGRPPSACITRTTPTVESLYEEGKVAGRTRGGRRLAEQVRRVIAASSPTSSGRTGSMATPVAASSSPVLHRGKKVRANPPWLPILDRGPLLPIPPELACTPPRPDVWCQAGYLHGALRDEVLPLLTGGHASPGRVVEYCSRSDNEGPDTSFTYAWRDGDKLIACSIHESYDGLHAALGKGMGQPVIDADLHLKLGKPVTVIYDPSTLRCYIYEALLPELTSSPA